MSDPIRIGDIIAQLIKETPLGDQLEQARIWEHWPTLAGDPLWMHGRPVALRDGTLIVEAENTVWMHKYAFHRRRLMRRINKMFRRPLVEDVFIRLGDGTSRAAEEVPGGSR